MDRSSKKRRDILIWGLVIVTLVAVVVVFVFCYTGIHNEEGLNGSNHRAPVTADIVIQPGSHWYYHINYSSMNVVITLISGNFSALQPLIIDDTNFALFQQGKPYQYTAETSNMTYYKGLNYSGDIHAYGSNLIIINNDRNNTSIVTIELKYQPNIPVP